MNLDAVLVVDESHHVVTRNGVAAGREDKLIDVFFGQDERLLLVEILAHHKEFQWFYDAARFLLLLVLAQEWDVVTPARRLLLFLGLALQLIEVFLSKQDAVLAQRLEEVVSLLYVVEFAELVHYRVGHL